MSGEWDGLGDLSDDLSDVDSGYVSSDERGGINSDERGGINSDDSVGGIDSDDFSVTFDDGELEVVEDDIGIDEELFTESRPLHSHERKLLIDERNLHIIDESEGVLTSIEKQSIEGVSVRPKRKLSVNDFLFIGGIFFVGFIGLIFSIIYIISAFIGLLLFALGIVATLIFGEEKYSVSFRTTSGHSGELIVEKSDTRKMITLLK